MPIDIQSLSSGAALTRGVSGSISVPAVLDVEGDPVDEFVFRNRPTLLGTANASSLFEDQTTDYYITYFALNLEENNVSVTIQISGGANASVRKDFIPAWETSSTAVRLEYGRHSYTLPGPTSPTLSTGRRDQSASSTYIYRIPRNAEIEAFISIVSNAAVIQPNTTRPRVSITLVFIDPTFETSASGLLPRVDIRDSTVRYISAGFASAEVIPRSISISTPISFPRRDARTLEILDWTSLGAAGASPLFEDQTTYYQIRRFVWNTAYGENFELTLRGIGRSVNLTSDWETSLHAITIEYEGYSYTLHGPRYESSSTYTDSGRSPYSYRLNPSTLEQINSITSQAFRSHVFNAATPGLFGHPATQVQITFGRPEPDPEPSALSGVLPTDVNVQNLYPKSIDYMTFLLRSG